MIGVFSTTDDTNGLSQDTADTTRNLSPEERKLLERGEKDTRTITKLTVTVHYNSDVAGQMLAAPPELFLHNLAILPTNYGYFKSRVPIKVKDYH